MLSCEFSEIPKNNFFTEHLQWLLLQKQHTSNNKINSDYLGDKMSSKKCLHQKSFSTMIIYKGPEDRG